MLVLFSTLWFAFVVLRGQGRALQSNSVIIFDNISRPLVRVPLIHVVTAMASQGFCWCLLALASPNLAPESFVLCTDSSVGFRSLELITVCGFNRRNN